MAAYGSRVFPPDSWMYIYQYPALALQFTVRVWNLELSRLSTGGRWVGEELNLTGRSSLDLQVDFVIVLAQLGFLGPDRSEPRHKLGRECPIAWGGGGGSPDAQ